MVSVLNNTSMEFNVIFYCDFLLLMTDVNSVSVSNPYFGGGGENDFLYELNDNSGGGCSGNYYYYGRWRRKYFR